MRAALLAAVPALALAACGEGEADPRVSAPPSRTDLVVRVTGAGPEPVRIALRCDGAPACGPRRLARLEAVLARAGDAGRVCTEVYGGPERARVRGRLQGRRVDVRVARTDGCGIADYDELFGALGRPAPLAG